MNTHQLSSIDSIKNDFLAALLILFFPFFVQAELLPLSDEALHQVNGQSSSVLSYTLDNYSAASEDFYLELGVDSGVPTEFSKLSLVGSSSSGYFNSTNGFTIGSRSDPFTLTLQEEIFTDRFNHTSAATSLVYAFPIGHYRDELDSSIDSTFNLTTLISLTHLSGNELHTWLSLKGVSLDNTYTKFWVAPSSGLSISGLINLRVDQFVADANNIKTNEPGFDTSSQWVVDNLELDLPLGNTLYQPLNIDIDDDLNLILELKAIDLASAEAFYNADKGNLYVDNITMNGYESGAIEIEGIQLQYLKVTTHDLL